MSEPDTLRQQLRRMEAISKHLCHLDRAGLLWVRSVIDYLLETRDG